MDSQPMQRCDNCLKEFSESKMSTHYGYCRRNIKKCPTCLEMFDINFKDQHEEEFHRKQKCPHCSKEFPSSDFKAHEKNCSLKPKFCEYCQLNVPVAGFTTHFKACQSRTKPCSKCNKPIMNKDYLIHFVSCEGIVEAPRQPTNYQEHILQQQQKREEAYSQNQNNRVLSREKPAIIKPKEEKVYTGIVNRNSLGQQRIVYEPRIINNPRQEMEKREAIKYPPTYKPEPRREEVVYPPKRNTGNLIIPSNIQKKEETRTSGLRPSAGLSNEHKRSAVTGSREAPRNQVSSKQIPQYEYMKPSIKDSKSIQRNGYIKREEEQKNKYGNQNINPKVPQFKQNSYEFKAKIPPPQQIVRQKSPYAKNEYVSQQFDIHSLGLTPQEQMMQEILMQSANDHKGKNQHHIKPVSKNEARGNQVPYIEGEDIMNQSFIAKQRAIQQEFSRQRKGGR